MEAAPVTVLADIWKCFALSWRSTSGPIETVPQPLQCDKPPYICPTWCPGRRHSHIRNPTLFLTTEPSSSSFLSAHYLPHPTATFFFTVFSLSFSCWEITNHNYFLCVSTRLFEQCEEVTTTSSTQVSSSQSSQGQKPEIKGRQDHSHHTFR